MEDKKTQDKHSGFLELINQLMSPGPIEFIDEHNIFYEDDFDKEELDVFLEEEAAKDAARPDSEISEEMKAKKRATFYGKLSEMKKNAKAK